MDPQWTTVGAPTQRVRLARAALAAACGHADVAGGHGGPDGTRRTPDDACWLTGITAVAAGDGRYDIGLHLIARPVPLHPLAAQVEQLVRQAAADRGMGPVLGGVTVAFEDLDGSRP